jgi:hypothetical protein
MSKQTAVEWLTEMITNMIHEAHHSELADLFESAKAMERERIEDAWNSAYGGDANHTGEEYFNQTYGGDK